MPPDPSQPPLDNTNIPGGPVAPTWTDYRELVLPIAEAAAELGVLVEPLVRRVRERKVLSVQIGEPQWSHRMIPESELRRLKRQKERKRMS